MVSVLLSAIGCCKSWLITGGLGGLAGCGGMGCLHVIGKGIGEILSSVFIGG